MKISFLNKTTDEISISCNDHLVEIISPSLNGIWGMGEHYDFVNYLGRERRNHVVEKFTHQGSETYLPIPIILTDRFSLFCDTNAVFTLASEEKDDHCLITLKGAFKENDILYLYEGLPKDALGVFIKLKGGVVCPPSWVFGQWASANRWNSVSDVEAFLAAADENGFDFTALVLEAWSDESTFYRFNPEPEGLWSEKKQMMEALKQRGIHLLLWQCPVIKCLEEGRRDKHHEADIEYVLKHGLVIKNKDGSAYRIPEGHWFAGSFVPDFTNPEMVKWWFEKRKPLLELGISGFKTDGGEFILSDDAVAFNGMDGSELGNLYPELYVKSYLENIGKDKVTFSRAGYTGASSSALFWAGDQMSEWCELESVMKAGISAAVSGVFFWGFDIAGFAGPLPGAELYIRSYELATFVPIMQWHSEPLGGQFSEIAASDDMLNDRSPWNIALRSGDNSVLEICRRYSSIRSALRPYIEREAEYSSEANEPMMRPLFYDYPERKEYSDIYDEYMFGRSILVAPVLYEGASSRSIIIPSGIWYDVVSRETVTGPCTLEREYSLDEIGLFILASSPDYMELVSILS